jgi:hypothetical protein
MVRKNKRTKKSKRSNKSGGFVRDAITVSCRRLAIYNLTAGVATVTMAPSTFIEAAAVSDVFELYRITKLRYRLYRHATLGATATAVYIAGVVDNPPSTAADASVSPYAAVITPIMTQPSEWKSISKRDLASYSTWYKTVAGSPDPSLEEQGKIYLAGTTTDAFTMEVEIVYQFKSPCTTSATPAERGALERLRERERLLKILSSSPTTKL